MRRPIAFLLVLFFAAVPQAVYGAERKPNIIFIMADDLGYGDIGPYGQKKIRTPRLDRMAGEGMTFSSYYPGAAVCAPTRGVLMTGLHTGHARVRGNKGAAGVERVPLEPEDVTVAELLRSGGYATAHVGKWGLGEPGTTGVPTRQGFDLFFGYLNQDHAEDYYPATLWRNESEVALPENAGGARGAYTHDLFTEEGLRFIAANRDRPFFLYLAYTVPHDNWDVPADSVAEYEGEFPVDPEEQRRFGVGRPNPRAVYAGMITRLDRDVGRILDRLGELGIDRDTAVFFCSDNGATDRADNGPGVVTFFNSNGGWRGWKGSLHEGGIRSPMIVRWPGRIPAGRRSEYVWAGWDFMATAAEIAGVRPVPDGDGRSALPVLLGREMDRGEFLYWEIPGKKALQQAARRGRLKALRSAVGQPIVVYDLAADPREQVDVADKHPGFVRDVLHLFRTARTPSTHWPVPE